MEEQIAEYELSNGTSFQIFDHIDQVLLEEKERDPYAVKVPKVWPSAASVELYDQTKNKIAGKCQRSVLLSMMGVPSGRKLSPDAAWKMLIGNIIENQLNAFAKRPTRTGRSIHVASGVRVLVEDILLSFELDLVVISDTGQGILTEQKTYTSKNYQKSKEIFQGTPAVDNLIQLCLYLQELKTGKRLKEVIKAGLEDRRVQELKDAESKVKLQNKIDNALMSGNREELDRAQAAYRKAEKFWGRNRIEVTLENLEKMSDGPLGAKLGYLDRSDGYRKEMNIELVEDSLDHLTYPVVDGQVWRMFPIESIYNRFLKLQEYFRTIQFKAIEILAEKGITPPEEIEDPLAGWAQKSAFYAEERAYYEQLGDVMRSLPASFWPPAEYELDYSPEKIELLWSKSMLAKTRYEGWKRKHKGKERIGDWQCSLCDHMLTCQKIERPDLAPIIQDIADAQAEEVA